MNWNIFNAGWGKNIAPVFRFYPPPVLNRDEYMHFQNKQVRRNTFFQAEKPLNTLFYSSAEEVL